MAAELCKNPKERKQGNGITLKEKEALPLDFCRKIGYTPTSRYTFSFQECYRSHRQLNKTAGVAGELITKPRHDPKPE